MSKLTALALATALVIHATHAFADVAIKQEPADGNLRLGQRVYVDDGTCPVGQVKLVTAAQLTEQGIVRTRVCVSMKK